MLGNTFLRNRTFLILGVIITVFVLSYSYPLFFRLSQGLLILLIIALIVDWLLLKNISTQIQVERRVAPKLSLGDIQKIQYQLQNSSTYPVHIELLDEFPFQLQLRNFSRRIQLSADHDQSLEEDIRPLTRGLYQFGRTRLFISTPFLSLLDRRITRDNPEQIKVVPSIIQMRKYALQVFTQTATASGIRKIRQIGENDEFEQIKYYQQGDNVRSINWKATSRKNQLMVNQFQNTRSQMIYSIIDKGRSMKMPFDGLSLLDYAINSTLVISNIILKKYDKAGLITFSDKMGQLARAESTPKQLSFLAELLYNQSTDFKEANFELLFYTLQRQVRRRSVLLFFTNFEHMHDLDRNLPFLQALNRRHLMVVIFFTNTGLIHAGNQPVQSISDLYLSTFATKTLVEKEQIRNRLQLHGIQTILTKPEDLSVAVINKYLEIKAKRMK